MRSSSADMVIVDELLWYARLKNARGQAGHAGG